MRLNRKTKPLRHCKMRLSKTIKILIVDDEIRFVRSIEKMLAA